MYQQIPFGTQEENKIQCVFVVFHHCGARLYKNYEQKGKAEKDTLIPQVLMVLRWDGKIGFPGGKVDKGETLTEAAAREAKEEINVIIPQTMLKPMISFSTELANIHSFSCEVSPRELFSIRDNASKAEHFNAESAGVMLVHMINYEGKNGLKQFLKHNFADTAGIELEYLATSKGWLK